MPKSLEISEEHRNLFTKSKHSNLPGRIIQGLALVGALAGILHAVDSHSAEPEQRPVAPNSALTPERGPLQLDLSRARADSRGEFFLVLGGGTDQNGRPVREIPIGIRQVEDEAGNPQTAIRFIIPGFSR